MDNLKYFWSKSGSCDTGFMTAVSGSDPDGYVLEEDELPAIGQGRDANRVSGGSLCLKNREEL